MVVPVVFGNSSFDYAPLRSEQARLSKTLVLPSPRDKDDTAQNLEIEDDPTIGNGTAALAPDPNRVPFKYPTFIKMRFDKEGDLPIFELWMKDNFDQEHKISKESLNAAIGPGIGGGTINATTVPATHIDGAGLAPYQTGITQALIGDGTAAFPGTRVQINDNPLIAGTQHDGGINNSFAVNPITGDIYRHAYWDHNNREVKDFAGRVVSDPAFTGDLLGTVKFDGASGLALAGVNTRIAAYSNAVEGITKVLSVVSGNIDAVLAVVR